MQPYIRYTISLERVANGFVVTADVPGEQRRRFIVRTEGAVLRYVRSLLKDALAHEGKPEQYAPSCSPMGSTR